MTAVGVYNRLQNLRMNAGVVVAGEAASGDLSFRHTLRKAVSRKGTKALRNSNTEKILVPVLRSLGLEVLDDFPTRVRSRPTSHATAGMCA